MRSPAAGSRIRSFRELVGATIIVLTRRAARPIAPGAAMSFAPAWLFSGLLGPASGKTLWTITFFFAQTGAFVFGSGLAIVPFLYGGVVEEYGWLTDQQFLDAVAVAMITPGPVVITVAFIGYLVAGFAGACLAALGTFLPCWLFTVLPAPYLRRFAKNRTIAAFVDGVTAAATGSITGAAMPGAAMTGHQARPQASRGAESMADSPKA